MAKKADANQDKLVPSGNGAKQSEQKEAPKQRLESTDISAILAEALKNGYESLHPGEKTLYKNHKAAERKKLEALLEESGASATKAPPLAAGKLDARRTAIKAKASKPKRSSPGRA